MNSIPLHRVHTPRNIEPMMDALRSVLASGWVGEGPQVAAFERGLIPVIGTEHVTAVNSGTSALTLALRLAGVGPGDEVITTPMTCMATNLPILLAGAMPVWADIDPGTGNISPASVEAKITAKTKAIMAVHWGGYPAEVFELNAIASTIGVKVIEDAAHALGATYGGQPIGSHSHFVCFSFQAIKHIHTGDGGLIACRSMVDHMRARSLKWFGIDRERRQVNDLGIAEWQITEAGYKFHLNDIAATVGLSLLPELDQILAARRANAMAYREAFAGLKRVKLLHEGPNRRSACWLFTLKVDDQRGFIRHLGAKGIAASIVHARNDRAPVFAGGAKVVLPGVDEFAGSMVCIPVGQWVDDAARERVVEAVTSEGW